MNNAAIVIFDKVTAQCLVKRHFKPLCVVTVLGRQSLGGCNEGPHQCALVPGVGVEQVVVVLQLLTRHPERRVRVVPCAQLHHHHRNVAEEVAHILSNVLYSGVRVEP